jgi:hypothetical protein
VKRRCVINENDIKQRLADAFGEPQATALAEAIQGSYVHLVKINDFNELRDLVGTLTIQVSNLTLAQQRTEQRVEELAAAQQRTEQRVEELAAAQQRTEQRVEALEDVVQKLAAAQQRTEQRVEELAAAQQRTEQRVEALEDVVQKLAAAQQRTEQRVEELAAAQQRTEAILAALSQEVRVLTQNVDRLQEEVRVLNERMDRVEAKVDSLSDRVDVLSGRTDRIEHTIRDMQKEIGGMSASMGYALENEAYRILPAFLQEHYGIKLARRLIRTEIGGREINLFGEGEREGRIITLVGETKTRLDERRKKLEKDIFAELEERVQAVVTERGIAEESIVRLLVTHYARPGILQEAQEQGIIIVQSFEW